MDLAAKIITGVASVLLVGGIVASTAFIALSSPAHSSAAEPASVVATPTATPEAPAEPEPLTELPEWAKDTSPWLVYPDGFECEGTEGCPNDYRAFFGEPGDPLPAGVEYFDPAKHIYNPDTNTGIVFPKGHTIVESPDQ
ncbi:hypothetical protein J2X85_000048 [Microbacterium trichothecenolyticum]|uniref:hypothetical protein n=1 Tax=Microbacterium trichothecenolyticum TaxID=69370 RepID=UPI002858B08B|nr:hypothetical protein [Microbacterium trichothecenolyticum]MDR7183025.1 hypothetical protein [Microbacterium trichothecenolyticum]